MNMRTLLLVGLLAGVTAPAFAQLAIETMPGVTRYGGHTLGVETLPGVTHFSGAVNGTAVEITPGVTSYNLRPSLDSEVDQHLATGAATHQQKLNQWQRDQAERLQRDRQFLNNLSR